VLLRLTGMMSAICSILQEPPDSQKVLCLPITMFINNGKCIGDCMDLSTADRMLIQVPMFHCFGMVAFNDSLCDSWFHNVSDTVFFTEGGFGLY